MQNNQLGNPDPGTLPVRLFIRERVRLSGNGDFLLFQRRKMIRPFEKCGDQDFPVFVIFLDGFRGPGGFVWAGRSSP